MLPYDMASLSSTDVWLVGNKTTAGFHRPIALHWDGQTWQRFRVPRLGNSSSLDTVVAISADDVWAGGYWMNDADQEVGLLEHWNGARWSRVDAPSSGGFADLYAIDADDIWAVGGNSNPEQGFIDHWDGSTWSAMNDPGPPHTLTAVTSVASDQAFTVGIRSYHTVQRTYGERWDGQAWSTEQTVDPDPKNSRLRSIASTPSGTVFAVGDYGGSGGRNREIAVRDQHSLIERWQDGAWAKTQAPSPHDAAELNAVCLISDTDGWAVGNASKGGQGSGLALHWDGTSWTQVVVPSLGESVSALFTVAPAATDDVWAAGTYENQVGRQLSYVIHWDGTAWTVV